MGDDALGNAFTADQLERLQSACRSSDVDSLHQIFAELDIAAAKTEVLRARNERGQTCVDICADRGDVDAVTAVGSGHASWVSTKLSRDEKQG